MTLAAQHICKKYGKRNVLIDCSLTVNAGQCVLLRGPSGGGKSTFLRILSLLEPADSGSVRHGERQWEVNTLPEASPYPFLTVVFQQLFLWPNLTLAQNLSIVLRDHPDAPLPDSARETLERLSIAHLLQALPHECSLGERQRLAVARALLSPARFLLLDEPSSALDRANRSIVAQELSTALSEGRGVLLITHDDHGFDKIVDEAFELEHGTLETTKFGPQSTIC